MKVWTKSGVRHTGERWYWICCPGSDCAVHPVTLARTDDGDAYIGGNRGWLGVSWGQAVQDGWRRSIKPIPEPKEPRYAR